MELVVFVDFNSAGARLALHPTRDLAGELGIGIDWRPFSRKPKKRSGAGARSKGATHARLRADYRRWEEAFYAEQQGIALVYPDPEQEAFAANAGLAWLCGQGCAGPDQCDAYVKRVFERVWSGAMDPRDTRSVRESIADAGCNTAGFERWLELDAERELESHRRQAFEWGAVDVPGYVAAGEPFVGRQNLPIIRSLLTA